MNKTSICWTDFSWNVVTGCSRLCDFCYAKRISDRFHRSFTPSFHPERLDEPRKRVKPARIFACSMGDLFDPAITDEQIDMVFEKMAWCQQHTFQVLTKRPERMRQWEEGLIDRRPIPGMGVCTGGSPFCMGTYCETHESDVGWCGSPWPLPNIWLGTSITNQADADERIPHLLETPAAVRWVSIEPLLQPVWLSQAALDRIHWVVIGGLSPKPVHKREWIDSIIAQCDAVGVPVFVKANAGYLLERQEFPEVSR